MLNTISTIDLKKMFEDIPRSCRYGYARVSSISPEEKSSLEYQEQEFIKFNIPKENIRFEVNSTTGTISDRPVFYKLINHDLKENDLLIVTGMDRCSQKALEFLQIQEKLFNKNVTFISLDLAYSNDMAANKFIATYLAALATFEYNRRKGHQKQDNG